MAVYTTLSESQVNQMLAHFQLPMLAYMEGANDGVENTTYFITLIDQRRFVLTVFEMVSAQQLPPYIELMHYCHDRNLPVPSPLLDRNGKALQYLVNKPALLFPRATGKHVLQPSLQQCVRAGKALAQLHLATQDFPLEIPNPCGLAWAESIASFVSHHLHLDDRNLLNNLLILGRNLQSLSLPRGIIHGDLFRDNILFEGDHISAIIDFYNAGKDILLLDLAITVNDWCFDNSIQLHTDRQSALLDAYQSVRPLEENEKRAWQDCLKWAACRFWLSRLNVALRCRETNKAFLKNPTQYRDLLLFHLSNSL